MQYYRENAGYKERTYAFVPLVGTERVQAVVLEDIDGIAATLDAALAISVSATFDP